MKIEMGESLCASWLKHVKKCQIVQMNWKPSCFWDESELNFVKSALEKLDAQLQKDDPNLKIFPYKKGKKPTDEDRLDVRQTVGMTECDVVGIHLGKDRKSVRYYGVESAFHSDGLHYKATARKVASKLVRAILALYLYLGATEIEVAFFTPLVKKSVLADIKKLLDLIRNYFSGKDFEGKLNCQIDFYTECNGVKGSEMDGFKSFNNEVANPLVRIVPFTDDDSELFMRSLLMAELGRKQSLPVRSSLRSAYLSSGLSFDEFARLLSDGLTSKYNSNERTAINGYRKWIENCALLKKNDA